MTNESARSVESGTIWSKGRTSLPRRIVRIVLPLVMLGVGTYTVWHSGLQGLIALLPILAAHVVGFLVIYPLWLRYRQRRGAGGKLVENEAD